MKVKEFIAKLDKNYDISFYYDDEDKYMNIKGDK